MRVALVKFGDVVLELTAASGVAAPEFEGGNRYVRDFLAATTGSERILLSIGETSAEATVEGVKAVARRVMQRGHRLIRMFDLLRALAWAGRQLKVARPDVIVCLDTGPLAYVCLRESRRSKARLVIVGTTDTAGSGPGRFLRSWIADRVLRWRLTSGALACSSVIAAQMTRRSRPGLGVTVYHPDYAEAFARFPAVVPLDQRARDVVFVGRLASVKGSDALTTIAAALRDVDGARLVVIGDGPDREEIEHDVLAKGVGPAIRLRGTLPHHEVLESMAHSRLVVVPSRSEGVAKVALESVLSGTPVVAFEVGGVPDTVIDGVTGRLVPAGDITALNMTLEHLLVSDDEYAALLDGVIGARESMALRSPTFGQALQVVLEDGS